jgi:tungstate transport system ATP-binding protein
MPEPVPKQEWPVQTATPTLLRAKGLIYTAASSLLIDNVDVSVGQGERLAILGANGAGKSLLLRLLHGLIAADSGEVLWRGLPLGKAARDRQAMVFQRPILLRRSVAGNLRFALGVKRIGGAERRTRIDAALAAARLTDLADRPARVLSGGEQQRLALARALITEPEILFLDEPTASLDAASTALIETQITQANARGVTVVMVTHDAGQARRVSARAIFLHRGRVVEEGPTARLLDQPRSLPLRVWTRGELYLGPDGGPVK